MITHLSIRNFAIIDELSLDFQPGLNVLSGETGAGKSIILNAANLILGGRPSSELIRTGEREMEVEAAFLVENEPHCRALLEQWGMAVSDEIVVRRVVSSKGPNKVFVNGSPVTVAMLSALGPHLMSVVGQYDQQILIHPETHLDLLDEFAGCAELRNRAAESFAGLDRSLRERRSLLQRREREAERLELLRFQYREIEQAGLHNGEDEDLEAERTKLRNAETLSRAARNGYDLLYGADRSLLGMADEVKAELERAAELDPALKSLGARLKSTLLELEDVALGLRDYAKDVVNDPDRLEAVENRLAEIRKLGRKYGEGADKILERWEQVAREIEKLKNASVDMDHLEKEIERYRDELFDVSQTLSGKRRECADTLARGMEKELSTLNMKKLVFHVRIDPLPPTEKDTVTLKGVVMGPRGMDTATFMISPNKGEEPRPLARIASGGELSRMLLALRSILAGRGDVETLVFDEVDAGIGGRRRKKSA